MNRIVLIGHGYVGRAIHEYLGVNGVDHDWVSHGLALAIEPSFSGVIINAAGYTGSPNVDVCEIKKMETLDGNVVFPVRLHERLPRARVIHVGSGCIYNGDNTYTERDEPNFTFETGGSFYSGCKAYAEKLIANYMYYTDSVILRMRMPFDSIPSDKNLLTKFEKYSRIVDVTNSMSRLNDVCRVVAKFATGDISAGGIFNCTNPGSVSHRQVLEMMGLDKDMVDPITFGRELIVAPRSHCTLSSDKLSRYVDIPNVVDALRETIEEYKKSADR